MILVMYDDTNKRVEIKLPKRYYDVVVKVSSFLGMSVSDYIKMLLYLHWDDLEEKAKKIDDKK